MPHESCYLHGTAPEEQARLDRLNSLINQSALRELALQPGQSVLDVGCGLGQLTRAMARQVGSAKVIGIERSENQLAQARVFAAQANETDLVDFRVGEASQLSLKDNEWGTFDVAHTRFVLEHLQNPLAAVREMVRAVKPGGRIILEDDNHDTFRLWPEPPGFGHLWRSYIRTYDRVGNDPLIGHRLVSLIHQAGAIPLRNTWLFFGSCAGQADLPAYVDNLIRILEGVKTPILELGEFDEISFDKCLTSVREWATRPDAAMWYAISWAEGKRAG